jgi:hypothetical protein
VRLCGRLDEADGLLERRDRVVLEPEREREVEDDLGVRRSVHLGEQGGVDGEHEISPEQVEVGDEAVVDEQPLPVPEGMAIGLLHRRADGCPHMGQEQRGLDVRRELTQVGIAPGGRDAVVDARARSGSVPAEAHAVAVGRLGPIRACRLWSTIPCCGLNNISSINSGCPNHAIQRHISCSSFETTPCVRAGLSVHGPDLGRRVIAPSA